MGTLIEQKKQDVRFMMSETEIVVDPRIMHGAPCISGTRIPVYVILEKLGNGYSFDDILEAYPSLTVEQVKASIKYATEVLEKI